MWRKGDVPEIMVYLKTCLLTILVVSVFELGLFVKI